MDPPSAKRRKTLSSPTKYASYRSYMSPTKASLARFNPALLPNRGSKSAANSPLRTRLENAKEQRRQTVAVTNPAEETLITETTTPTSTSMIETPSKTGRGEKKDEEVEGEDDLPETPQKLLDTPEYKDTPPRGILYSSREKGKRKRNQDSEAQSEPARNEDEYVPEPDASSDRVDSVAEGTPAGEDTTIRTTRLSEEIDTTETVDPEIARSVQDKTKELERLKDEIRKADKDVRTLEKHISLTASIASGEKYNDIQELIELATPTSTAQPQTQQRKPAPTLLSSFLLFSLPTKPLPSLEEEAFDPSTLASHHPLPPKPDLLNLFTPLSLTSTLSTPTALSSTSTAQTHTLHLSAPHNLLKATLAMTVVSSATEPPRVERLQVDGLSAWAAAEVGPWIAEAAQAGDAAAVGHALGRYWTTSVARARAWARLERRYPQLAGADAKLARGPVDEEGLGVEQVARHLGRATFRLRDEFVDLRLRWEIGLDWAGDVASKVAAKGSFPEIWHQADERASLRRVPRLFEGLVQKFGAANAMVVLAELLFKNHDGDA